MRSLLAQAVERFFLRPSESIRPTGTGLSALRFGLSVALSVAALPVAAQVIETLRGPGPLAVLAPSNDAFAALAAGAVTQARPAHCAHDRQVF